MTLATKSLLCAAATACVLGLSGASASAAIACSGRVCWHTQESYDYPHRAHIVVHEDNWRWGPREHYTFREHEGRGYWRGGRWTEW